MSGIFDVKVIRDYMRMCADGVGLGWHERNGGNLTYRMTEEEVAQCRPFFREEPGEWTAMGVWADNLKGEYFISTGSGKYLSPRTTFVSWRSTRREIPGALCGDWKAAESPPASFPATL